MNIPEFADHVRKTLCCDTIYYPNTKQVRLFLKVNGKPCVFVYDEEWINHADIEEIMSKIDDDMWCFAYWGGRRKQ